MKENAVAAITAKNAAVAGLGLITIPGAI